MRYPPNQANSNNTTDKPHKKNDSKHQNYCRFLLFFSTIAALIGNVIDHPLSETITLALASLMLVYSFVAYSLNDENAKPNTLNILSISDGFIIALAISELHYSPWPSLLLLSLLYFNAIYQGGIKHWLFINLGLAMGLVIGFFALNNQAITPNSHNVVNISIAISSLLYLCLYSLHIRKRAKNINDEHERLANEVKEQKLRAYEISRYLPKSAWDQIEGKTKAKIERKPITIFFSDIVGFSRLSEELEAETLSNVLSSYLAEMSLIVEQFNGTIDKFIGDAIMVTFGDDDSLSQGVKKDAIACVSMAIAMGKRMRELQSTWAEMGIKKPLQIRIGINSGYCTVGTFGISKHLDHTALGVHVNLASRLESAGQPEEILVSHETWSLIKDSILCKDKGQIKAKGFTHPVQVYQVINHRKELGSHQSYFSQTTDGFSIHLDMQKVKNYDREKVISTLELAAKKLKDKMPT